MRRIVNGRIIFFVVLILFVASTALAGNPKSRPFLPDIPQVWTKITPGSTNFMGRNLVPICSGYPTTNPTFSFFVKGGTVNNVVVYFQGGGACWNWLTCIGYPPSKLPTFYPDVTDADNPALIPYGIFDLSNPDNPFKDWSFVFIPYCTGDLHRGSNDWEYTEPVTSTKWTIHHRGFDNFLVVLKWIIEHFEKPHEIFVTGSSAGSYGAISDSPWIKEAYPNSKVSVLGDAGMGISPEAFSEYTRPIWNVQLPEWIFAGNPPDSNAEIWKEIAAYYPHSKFAEFTNAWDMTQIYFYDLILQTLGFPHGGSCASWNAQMLSTVDDKQGSPNYRSYLAAGQIHTILGRPQFYTENSAGVSLLDWLDAMVDNQGGTNGHGGIPWKNVECTECNPPLACPY